MWDTLSILFSDGSYHPRLQSSNNSVTGETYTYQVQFLDGAMTHLCDKLTGETYTLPLVGGVPSGLSGRSGLWGRNSEIRLDEPSHIS